VAVAKKEIYCILVWEFVLKGVNGSFFAERISSCILNNHPRQIDHDPCALDKILSFLCKHVQ